MLRDLLTLRFPSVTFWSPPVLHQHLRLLLQRHGHLTNQVLDQLLRHPTALADHLAGRLLQDQVTALLLPALPRVVPHHTHRVEPQAGRRRTHRVGDHHTLPAELLQVALLDLLQVSRAWLLPTVRVDCPLTNRVEFPLDLLRTVRVVLQVRVRRQAGLRVQHQV